jgi:hypothetical protein
LRYFGTLFTDFEQCVSVTWNKALSMNMTRQLMVAVLTGACLMTCAVRGEDPAKNYQMIDGVGRGCANILCGAIEIPQNATYYAVEWPFIGVIPGIIQGSGMMAVRAFGGLVDLLTIGYLAPGSTVYDAMDEPLYPWQGPWVPTEEENADKATR